MAGETGDIFSNISDLSQKITNGDETPAVAATTTAAGTTTTKPPFDCLEYRQAEEACYLKFIPFRRSAAVSFLEDADEVDCNGLEACLTAACEEYDPASIPESQEIDGRTAPNKNRIVARKEDCKAYTGIPCWVYINNNLGQCPSEEEGEMA